MNPTLLLLGMITGAILYFGLDKFTPAKVEKKKTDSLLREFAIGGTLKWEKLARKYSAYRIEKNLILAVIAQESGGNRDSLGKAGEIGLMQILQPALTDVNRTYGLNYSFIDLWTPEVNIEVGAKYLALMNTQNKDIIKALQSYNAGATTVKNNPNVSIDYAKSVLDYKNTLDRRLI